MVKCFWCKRERKYRREIKYICYTCLDFTNFGIGVYEAVKKGKPLWGMEPPKDVTELGQQLKDRVEGLQFFRKATPDTKELKGVRGEAGK